MNAALAVIVPLGCTGAGHFLFRLLRVEPGLGPGTALAARFLAGSGAVSFVVFLALLAAPQHALAAGWALCLLLAVGAAVAAALRFRPRPADAVALARRAPRMQIALVAALAVETVLLIRGVLRYGPDNDAIAIWALKARVLAAAGSPAALLQDPSRLWSHPQYPLHVPLDMALVYQAAGGVDLGAVKVLFAAFALALVVLFFELARELRGTTTAALYGLVLLSVPYFVLNSYAIAADAALSALLLAGGGFLWLWLDRGGRDRLLLAGLFLAIGLWTKRDAAPIWAGSAAVVLIVTAIRRERLWGVLAYLAPAVPALVWYVYASRIGLAEPDFGAGHFDRLPLVVAAAAPSLLSGFFGLGWALLAIALLRPVPWTLGSACAALLVAFNLVAIGGGYIFSTWNPVTEHVTASYPRIALQVLPLALLVTLARFGAADLREGLKALGRLRSP